MEIELNRAYISHWDNIQYPIFELSDGSYLCIAYSCNHKCYYVNIYTKEDFIEQGFHEDNSFDEFFNDLTAKNIGL